MKLMRMSPNLCKIPAAQPGRPGPPHCLLQTNQYTYSILSPAATSITTTRQCLRRLMKF